MGNRERKPIVVSATMEHWNDVVSFNQLFLSHFVFRGQANAEWDLRTSLERTVNLHHPNYIDRLLPNIYESNMLEQFKYKYPLYSTNIQTEKDENLEWLALMQHYGAPTRLLDFSKSLFVALYMALDNSFSENCAIWGVNIEATTRVHTVEYMTENNLKSTPHSVIDEYIYNKGNSFIGTIPTQNVAQEIIPVHPKLCNERIAIQQGLFLMASDLGNPFMKVFNSFFEIEDQPIEIPIKNLLDLSYSQYKLTGCRDLVLFKIIIPKKFKWQLTQLLNQMNITAETLYPGLGGLAKSLSALQLRDLMYED